MSNDDAPPPPPRIWSMAMPFRKDGTPVVGTMGREIKSVVIMTRETWLKLCKEIPQLGTTKFEIGEWD